VAKQQLCLNFRPDTDKKIRTEVEHGDRTLTYLNLTLFNYDSTVTQTKTMRNVVVKYDECIVHIITCVHKFSKNLGEALKF
jgi:hypothetical protein